MVGTRIYSLLLPTRTVLQSLGSRSLMSDSILKLKVQQQYGMLSVEQISGQRAGFWKKIEEHAKLRQLCSLQELRMALTFAEKQHLPYLAELINRYIKATERQTTATKQFANLGASFARQCYLLNELGILEKIYATDSAGKAFDCPPAYIVYMDMLFEKKMYEKVVSTFERILKSNKKDFRNVGHFECLFIAALYKIGSQEALKKADDYWEQHRRGAGTIRRTFLLYAAMHLRKSNPEKALDILRSFGGTDGDYLTANMHMRVYMALDKWEYAAQICSEMMRGHSLLSDTWKRVVDNKKERLFSLKRCHIKYSTLDTELFSTLEADEPFQLNEYEQKESMIRQLSSRTPLLMKMRRMDEKIEAAAKELHRLEELVKKQTQQN